jgi:hypothetical protein
METDDTMSASDSFGNITQTTGGKIGVGILAVAAVGVLIFEVVHLSTGDQSRVVPAKEVVSEAQQQIDAINKMTNLSAEQRRAMIAHEQGEINVAQGSSTPSTGQPKQGTQGGN